MRSMGSRGFLDLQFERLLARRLAADILQVLYSQSSCLVWLPVLPVQIQKLALLYVGVLLLCQHTALAGSLGFPTVPNLPQGVKSTLQCHPRQQVLRPC